MNRTLQIAIGSLAVGLVVLALKLLAWRVTGSVALYSDAMESIVNVATALAALAAVRIALRPADANHPYGHHKAEYFSAVMEGVMIVVAALLILHKAWQGFLAPQPLDAPLEGLAINAAAGVLNAIWCWVLIREGRKLRSPALEADGRHLFTDVVSSLGVIAGVALAVVTGWLVLDPLLAALVALNILWSGWKVTKESMSGLMDEAAPNDMLAAIRGVISREAIGALEAHDVRTRVAGRVTFIDFHLVVPGDSTVEAAHSICDRIEAALKDEVPGAQITIHIEPEHKAKHCGVVVV
ncbi:cation diffusion facilitator family transporter [Camelimonas fluminis]|uniref:Cation diffusion facilitator family transporter n=1 Tax=Camelimonas fluminis TaxID=1576911 RepID=A0ABV7UCB3_9HYPH|nr:cation diffusion facilitator family transporter [Camelimonas fluminis]